VEHFHLTHGHTGHTGSVQQFVVPKAGTYKLECWGGSGGGEYITSHTVASSGGPGGYSNGNLKCILGKTLYLYVGGAGTYGTSQFGGWNGGGSTSTDSQGYPSGSGGGATDVRTINGECLNITSLNSRLIVAGGGGGSDNSGGILNGSDDGSGGAGGGTTGQGLWSEGNYLSEYGGTQSSGYSLGQGESAINCTYDVPGAGGGYYGGKMNGNGNSGGGGGSGYIGGVNNGQTIAGNNSMPNYLGTGTMIGNVGNGYAKITQISF